jgi:hypothetical protein
MRSLRACARGRAADNADFFLAHGGEQAAHRCLMAGVPQGGESFVPEFTSEQSAHARPGEAEAQLFARLRSNNKGVAQRGADRRRLDVAALRQRA